MTGYNVIGKEGGIIIIQVEDENHIFGFIYADNFEFDSSWEVPYIRLWRSGTIIAYLSMRLFNEEAIEKLESFKGMKE